MPDGVTREQVQPEIGGQSEPRVGPYGGLVPLPPTPEPPSPSTPLPPIKDPDRGLKPDTSPDSGVVKPKPEVDNTTIAQQDFPDEISEQLITDPTINATGLIDIRIEEWQITEDPEDTIPYFTDTPRSTPTIHIEDSFCRSIETLRPPPSVKLPYGSTVKKVFTENFDDAIVGRLPSTWARSSGLSVKVSATDKLAYSCPNSVVVNLVNAWIDANASRQLAPTVRLTDNCPQVIQFCAHFGAKTDTVAISLVSKGDTSTKKRIPLVEISRTAKEEIVTLNSSEISLIDQKTLNTYYFMDIPTEYIRSDGRLIEVDIEDTMDIVNRDLVTPTIPTTNATSYYSLISRMQTMGTRRVILNETYSFKYSDSSGNVVTTTKDILPYITDSAYKLKLYGWNCFTVVCYSTMFDLFVNGEKILDKAKYLGETYTAKPLYYNLGYLAVGSPLGVKTSTNGTVFLDNIDMYAVNSPSGTVIFDATTFPQTDITETEVIDLYPTETVPSGNNFTEDGALIVTLNTTNLLCDSRGSFTYSTTSNAITKYTFQSDIYVGADGSLSTNPSANIIRRTRRRNLYLGVDGRLFLGTTIDNRKDRIPFDVQNGEVVIVAALNTNDTRWTPTIDYIFFEFN